MDGKIYLIRHAKATHNRYDGKAVFAGGRADSDLTAEGESEAREMGCFFKDKDIKVIVHSPLIRSKHTAQIIKSEISSEEGIEMVECEYIREVDAGKFTGKTRGEIEKNFPEQLKYFLSGDIGNWAFPSGENYDQIKLRATKAVKVLGKIAERGNIIAIGHGMFNRVLLNILYPGNYEMWKPTSYPHDKIVEMSEKI